MAAPVQVTNESFEDDVLNSEVPVLVDFWAEWCGPCRMIAPIIEELAQDYDGKMKVATVDVDEHQGLAMRFSIMSLPTLGLFKQGDLIARIVGYVPKGELKRRLDAALAAGVG